MSPVRVNRLDFVYVNVISLSGTIGGMTEPTPIPDTPRQRFVSGVQVGTGMAFAGFVLALTFGALARSQGWGVLTTIVCSVIVFSGTAQFALVTALAAGGGIPMAVVAAAWRSSASRW